MLGLALARELTPVVTCIVLAGRVGSAFAAELGTMQVRAAPHAMQCSSACIPALHRREHFQAIVCGVSCDHVLAGQSREPLCCRPA